MSVKDLYPPPDSANYSSDEEAWVSWGPVTLREAKSFLQPSSKPKTRSRKTVGYFCNDNMENESEYFTPNNSTNNKDFMEKVSHALFESTTASSSYQTANEEEGTESQSKLAAAAEKEKQHEMLEQIETMLTNTNLSASKMHEITNNQANNISGTLENAQLMSEKEVESYEIDNFYATLNTNASKSHEISTNQANNISGTLENAQLSREKEAVCNEIDNFYATLVDSSLDEDSFDENVSHHVDEIIEQLDDVHVQNEKVEVGVRRLYANEASEYRDEVIEVSDDDDDDEDEEEESENMERYEALLAKYEDISIVAENDVSMEKSMQSFSESCCNDVSGEYDLDDTIAEMERACKYGLDYAMPSDHLSDDEEELNETIAEIEKNRALMYQCDNVLKSPAATSRIPLKTNNVLKPVNKYANIVSPVSAYINQKTRPSPAKTPFKLPQALPLKAATPKVYRGEPIVSPVRMYIKNTPTAPLYQNARGNSLPRFLPNTYVESNHNKTIESKLASIELPFVIYKPAKIQHTTENKSIKIIGHVEKLMPKPNELIKHEKRIARPQNVEHIRERLMEDRNLTFNDTIGCQDVSILTTKKVYIQ